MQSRRISVSSPYNRTAETDFGERKSEYDKNQREAVRLPFLNFELILVKSLNLNRPLNLLKTFSISLFRSALFWAAKWLVQKRCRIVEYPFRRRTTVRQRRISAREKVNTIKRRKSASGFPAFLKIDIGENLSFHKCLYPIKTFTFSLFRSALFWAATFYLMKSMMSRSIIGISLVRSRR